MSGSTKVFISHSSMDKQFAWKLVRYLDAYQLPIWFDVRELRPGDSLRQTIGKGVESSDFFIILVSKNSIKSSWVRFELAEAIKQQQSSNAPTVIPVLIQACRIPKAIKDILRVDFSTEWASGFSQLLRGICRDKLVVKLVLKKKLPLELETTEFLEWMEEYIFGHSPLLFVLDEYGFLDELAELAKKSSNANQFIVDLRYLSLLVTNFCIVLPLYLNTLRELISSDNVFLRDSPNSLQTLSRLVMYRFYMSALKSAFRHEIIKDLGDLKSVNGGFLGSAIGRIQKEAKANKYLLVGRREEAAILNLETPISVDLVGSKRKSIMDIAPLLISENNLAADLQKYWQFYAYPDTEIPLNIWIRVCMPQIAAEHIITCSSVGKTLWKYLNCIGLRKSDYERMGPH